MNHEDYIAELQAVILNLHGVVAEYVETVPVNEEFQGQTVWEGEVEVFDIVGHAKAKRAYAWGYSDDEDARRYVTVLEVPPVTSPEKAVRASIVKDYRERKENH